MRSRRIDIAAMVSRGMNPASATDQQIFQSAQNYLRQNPTVPVTYQPTDPDAKQMFNVAINASVNGSAVANASFMQINQDMADIHTLTERIGTTDDLKSASGSEHDGQCETRGPERRALARRGGTACRAISRSYRRRWRLQDAGAISGELGGFMNPTMPLTESILNQVDSVVNAFVHNTYNLFNQNFGHEMQLAFILYVALYGWGLMWGTIELDLRRAARHLLGLAIVYALITDGPTSLPSILF